jgi:hypothetical protein
MNINPFKSMFKMKSYSKWYHYFWAMPVLLAMAVYGVINNFFYGIYCRLAKK